MPIIIKQSNFREYKRHCRALWLLARSMNAPKRIAGERLYRELLNIEFTMSKASVAYCNGETREHDVNTMCHSARVSVINLFGKLPPSFIVNLDPRGYALKLASSDDGTKPATLFALHQDWGRNQILAPDFS